MEIIFSAIALVLIFVLVLGFLLWTFYTVHDFGVPVRPINSLTHKPKSKVLAIFPHPDDETMSSGGLLNKLSKEGHFIKAISITHGEAGNELINMPAKDLAKIRKKEFECATEKLGAHTNELWHFEDGKLINSIKDLKTELQEELENYNPDLIITYEKFGLYGHNDHQALTRALMELKPKAKILFSTIPDKLFKKFDFPRNMGEIDKPTGPEFRVNVKFSFFSKYKAAKCYKSQNLSRGKPLFLVILFSIFEYYTTKY